MDESSSEHKGRLAVITGGSGGIGNAIADRLQLEGASVTVMDLMPRAGRAKLESSSSPISFCQVDVAQEREVETAFKSVAAREGKIDYLICCAAIFHATPFLQLSGDEWKRTLDINLNGAFLCCREAIRYMRPRRFGRIILFLPCLRAPAARILPTIRRQKGACWAWHAVLPSKSPAKTYGLTLFRRA